MVEKSDILDALFKHSSEGIIITDKQGEIVMCNPKALELFGYEQEEELKGHPVEILVPKKDAHKHHEHRDDFIQHPKTRPMGKGMDLHGRRKDGSNFPLEISLSYFKTDGKMFVMSFIIDVTERKKKQEELKVAHLELKKRAKELEASNSELEQFAYVASHDLQEPLRKIRAFGGRLKKKEEESLSEKGQEFIDRMLNAAERMQVLINDLLAFSRITSKAKPFSEIKLNDLIEEVRSDMEVNITNTNTTFEVIDELPVIQADSTQIRQLLQNLFSNSIKFTRAGETPHITIQELKGESDEASTTLKLEDNGIGFDPKYHQKIFNIFQRLENSGKYSGSGIGLAICKKIVDRHDGMIWVESERDKGTKFFIRLPRKQH